jgi:hypothetical protein
MERDFLNRELEIGDIILFADVPSADYRPGVIYKFGKGTSNICYSSYGLTKRKSSIFLLKVTEEDLLNSRLEEINPIHLDLETNLMISLSRTLKNIPLNEFEEFASSNNFSCALERM